MRTLSVVLATTLLVCGCDPGFTMQGDVADASGHPIAGARVVLVCDAADQSWADTDATGHFKDGRIGVFGDDCAVQIRVAGHRPVSFGVMDDCTNVWRRWFRDDLCAEVTVHATIR
jgi:hypothetical protein